ncbi:hypothetical protein MNBD_GAMMA02-183, partial [hydrothermal vent metagenome]
MNKREIERFEKMSLDDKLKLEGDDDIALKKYNEYRYQLRQEQIKANEIGLYSFYEEVRLAGLNTDYYKGIKEHQLNKKVIQIILKHLDMNYSRDILQILVDKLQSRKAHGIAGAKLIELYKKADNPFRLHIAQILEVVATENELEELLSIFNNPDVGDEGKTYLPLVIAQIMGKQAAPILTKIVEEKKNLDEC